MDNAAARSSAAINGMLLSLVGSSTLWGDSLNSSIGVERSFIARSKFVCAKMEVCDEICQ